MTCQEFIDFLMDYADGVLPPEQRAQFDEHMSECPDCVNYLASYRATTVLGKAAVTTIPPDVPSDLVRAILAARHLL